MKRGRALAGAGASVLALMLAGCGDGSSGGPSTTPTPTPVNTSLAKLVASQSFANNAATGTASFDLTSGNTSSASAASKALTFSYDLASNSYTVSTDGRSQTFKPGDQSSASGGIAVYQQTNAGTTDRLTLESASVSGFASGGPQYSGLGYWQRYSVSGNTEATTIDFFTYGLNTATSAVPRTGQAAYGINLYGMVAQPGAEARFFQGIGRFDVDFASGVFVTAASTSEQGLATGKSYSGGLGLAGSGTLSSSANAFSGTVTYNGANSSSTGTLNGQFYGPTATELGGAFTTSGGDGSSTSGVIWGIQNSTLTPVNLSLGNIVADQTLASTGAILTMPTGAAGTAALGAGSVAVTKAGTTTVTPSGLAAIAASSANAVSGADANFASYGSGSTTLDLYKTGSANSELVLTYSSFARYSAPIAGGNAVAYQVYGLNTAANVIAARTGSASYTGVAYGTAYDGSSSASVKGTASFTAYFDLGGYSGSFGLKNSVTDYGTFNVSGTISGGTANVGGVTGTSGAGNGASGQFAPVFFGPNGQEFGGPFTITTPAGTTLVGAAIGKGG